MPTPKDLVAQFEAAKAQWVEGCELLPSIAMVEAGILLELRSAKEAAAQFRELQMQQRRLATRAFKKGLVDKGHYKVLRCRRFGRWARQARADMRACYDRLHELAGMRQLIAERAARYTRLQILAPHVVEQELVT